MLFLAHFYEVKKISSGSSGILVKLSPYSFRIIQRPSPDIDQIFFGKEIIFEGVTGPKVTDCLSVTAGRKLKNCKYGHQSKKPMFINAIINTFIILSQNIYCGWTVAHIRVFVPP